MTSKALAACTETSERYVREWLEQQTVVGILEIEDAQVEAGARQYRLPEGHDEVLVDSDSLNYLAPLSQMVPGRFTPSKRC